jgi:hypothetical protein
VDWGRAPATTEEVAERTAAALRGRADAHVAPGELDEVRIVGTWLAQHTPPALDLSGGVPGLRELEAFLRSSTHVRAHQRPPMLHDPVRATRTDADPMTDEREGSRR